MPLSDTARIAAQRTAPSALMLWRALQPLRGLARFMNTGAHPDDETSGMLAALSLRDGLSIAYACSTRGEGGQNDIGREAGADLGTLRTAEMERACDVLGMSMYWLSTSPADPITDFGFSKSGVETLGKWGRARTLRRMVEIIRADRPDMLCPTFLDIPGQHGHHRAMTEVAEAAMEAAADPGFEAEGKPWQVAKFYLPAWSGAGDAYDDDLPPPAETLRVSGAGREPVSGWSWEEIGQHARAFHATQGMGRWTGGAETAGWPLHLLRSRVGTDRGALTDNLPAGFADLAAGHARFAALDAALAATVAAFPDAGAVVRAAAAALHALRAARDACPPALADAVLHRLARKEAGLGRVLLLASGVRAEGRFARDHARPGETVGASLSLLVPDGPVSASLRWQLPADWQATDATITVAANAPAADPYPAQYHPGAPRGPVALALTLVAEGQSLTLSLPSESPLLVLPAREARVDPAAVFLNRLAPRPLHLRLSEGAKVALPPDWRQEVVAGDLVLHAPANARPGASVLPVTLEGHLSQTVTRIWHPHTGPLIRPAPAVLRLTVADVALAKARIGYVGGGHDRVDHWLRAMGAEVSTLDDAALSPARLAELDTLVVGIFALKSRARLGAMLPQLHAWVRAGGNLVTLYHRPWDNWIPDATPPARLEIGKPSLRFRVTDETAEVRHLLPEHPLLTGPNAIGPADWHGWVKERGLYFAKSWDPAYAALLEMADPGEEPQQGALLSARIGEGRHSHCALILHLQMEALVPGAFRLMANLIAPAR
ncbi:MAG: PIG-L family deacetylase [Phaeovulum sp.]|uniref:PIG-L family deacetylase n=1 Tax=Phaeovulum sp. TaxID=2934796 RepID=UPI002732DE5E|nr:PIG-L family deacetylase [Phaeovulum sp.]MDP3860709.1 PIG-L family deacetylase [Phaeovulum sp.]